MAAENIEVGKLSFPVMADLKPLERQAKTELKQRAQSIGREMVADLDRAFQAAQRRARGKLADRVLPKSEFKRLGKEAAEEFNRGLDEKIGQLNRAGKLTPAKLMQLEKFRKTGADAGFEFGDALQRRVQRPAEDAGREAGRRLTGGIMQQVNRLPSLIRAALGVALFTWIARGLRNIARQVASIATLAGTVQQVRGAFEARTAGAGIDSGELLRELRQATLHTVDSVELMRRANLLLNSELSLSAQNVGELAYLFRRLAEEQGRTAMDGFGAVSESIARLSPRQLAAYGITVRLEDATKKWAEANGRTASSLTTAERQLALYNAIVDQAREKVAGLNEEHVSTAQRVQQVATWWGELKAAIAEGIMQAPRVASFFESIGIGAADAADRVDDLADSITALIEAHGSGLKGAAIGGTILGATGLALGGPALGAAFLAAGTLGGSAVGSWFDSGVSFDEAKRQARERRLAREAAGVGRRGGTGVPGMPNADQLQAADAALRQLTASMREFQTAAEMGVTPLRDAPDAVQKAVRELVRAGEAVEQAEAQIAAIRAGGKEVPEAAEAYLQSLYAQRDALREIAQAEIARWQQELPLIVRGVENSISRLPGYMVQIEGAVRSLDSAVADLRTQSQEVERAERELLHARLTQDPERIAAAEKRIADERRRLRDMTAALARGLATAGIPAEKLNQLLAEMNELLEGAGMRAEDITDTTRDWEELARTFEGVARGVLSVADAMGILNDRQRRVLQGAINVASGIATGGIGGLVQAAGGIVGMFARPSQPDPEAEKLRRTMQANTEALEDLRRNLDKLAQVFGGMPGGEVGRGQAVFRRAEQLQASRWDPRNPLVPASWDRALDDALREAGMTMADLEALARSLGIEIDEAGAWLRVLESTLAEMDWDALVGSWSGAWSMLQAEFDLFDIDDPIEQLQRFRKLLLQFTDLPADMQAALEGFDLTTAEGQAAFEAYLQDIFQQILDGTFDLSLLGDLTPDEFIQWLRTAKGLVQDSGLVASGTPETRMAVNITQAQGNELLRIGSTQLYHLAGIHSLIAQMVSAPPPSFGAIPDISPPSPASLGLGGPTMIEVGGITVELALTAAQVTPGNAHDVGEQIGAGIGAGLTDRLRQGYRASGVSGPVRVEVS